MHITRNSESSIFLEMLAHFELKMLLVVKDKGIAVHIYRKFFLLIIPFNKLSCVLNAYFAIHYLYQCHVIGEIFIISSQNMEAQY